MSDAKGKHEVRVPDVEIVVRAASFDTLVCALYAGKTPSDGFEMVSTIYDVGDRLHLVEVLQEVIKQLRADDWITMAELDTRTVEDKKDPPF
jgi:hypothetical protein